MPKFVKDLARLFIAEMINFGALISREKPQRLSRNSRFKSKRLVSCDEAVFFPKSVPYQGSPAEKNCSPWRTLLKVRKSRNDLCSA